MAGKQTATNETVSAAEIESIETLLDDLPLEDENVEIEAVEEDVGEVEVTEDDLRDLELHEQREAAYSEQSSTTEANVSAVEEAKKDPAKRSAGKKRAQGKSTATPAPRTPRDLNSVPAEFFVLEGDVSAMSDEDKDAAKTATLALKPTQKKIAEKFENLFTALSAGKQPSVYVVQAFKLLNEKKTVTSSDIVAAFKGTYSQGTSMSQTGQIMNLFDAVKIANRSKQTLTLNENSVIAQRLRDVIAAANPKGA